MSDRLRNGPPFKARKRFGQHFLEPAWVRKLVDAIKPESDEVFLEIGPGRGALTLPLAERARRVVGIEIDRDLARDLQARCPANVTVIAGDFLDMDLESLFRGVGSGPIRVAGNLPYNISSPVLFRLLQASATLPIRNAVLMLQKEVADRLVARVGSKEYGVLTVQVALRADVDRLLVLPPGAFRPPPKVRSAVVSLAFRASRVQLADPALFDRLIRALFSQRRKTLLNALRPFAAASHLPAQAALDRARLDGGRRPETLELTELAALAELFCSGTSPAML